ncbi:2175_t:CDS:2, partial [Cetraspora pellucida]
AMPILTFSFLKDSQTWVSFKSSDQPAQEEREERVGIDATFLTWERPLYPQRV